MRGRRSRETPPARHAVDQLRVLTVLGLAVGFMLSSPGLGFTQAIDANLWATNGTVNAVVRQGGTIYVGGDFTRVARVTGGGGPIDATSGAFPPSFPEVNGFVYAVVSDGIGGWYIGGSFTAVGGLPRTNIAHVASDLSVTAWKPNASGSVRALAVGGGTVYAGGDFFVIGGQLRNYVAALNTTTGAATAWNPNASNTVFALAVRGTTVYAGGDFSSIGGQARNWIAALDVATGTATAWDPNANSRVNALTVSGTTIYAGGLFTSIGGQARNRLAALDTTGVAKAWNPNATNIVHALAVSDTTVYVGGEFVLIGGQVRNRVAAVGAAAGAVMAWNPNADGTVHALAVSGTTVYAGGDFTSIGGQARNHIAALGAATGVATAWNPNASGVVYALAASGSTVYAGGGFSFIGGQARNRIAAFDAATGAAKNWNPSADDVVYALAVSGTTVYAGGIFTHIGGQTRNRIAALDTTGAATSWNPNANGGVNAIAVSGATVYAGGGYGLIGGQARNRIAALDATGAATSWNPNASGSVLALAVSGASVYAGGDFQTIGVQARNYIAALDTATGAATTWTPNANSSVLALAVSDTSVYAGGLFTTIGGQARNYIAALNAATGAASAWNPNANSFVSALAVNRTTVYAGGAFVNIGGLMRIFLAALDARTGAAIAWNANSSDYWVRALALSDSTVYAGGLFNGIRGQARGHLVAIAAAPGILAVEPARGGDAGVVTVTVSGDNLRNGATVRLSRSGQTDIPGTGVIVAVDGLRLTATFLLAGKTHGLWDVVVVNPDLQTATLPNGFTIEGAAPHQLRVDVVGPAVMRPERRKAFDVVLENRGNNDELTVPLWITRIPVNATVEPDFTLAPPPRAGGEPDWNQAPYTFDGPGGKYLAMVIPRVPPGVAVRRIYLTVPDTVTSFELDAALTPPWVDGALFRSCLAGAGVIQAPACMGSQLTAINLFLTTTPGISALNGTGLWAKIAWQCEGSASLQAALTKAEQVLDMMLQPVEQSGVPTGCEVALGPQWRDSLAATIVTSVDPNDKLGLDGNGLTHQFTIGQTLWYSIRFENKDNATAPAQQAVVIDPLDGALVDLATVSLGPIKFGKRSNGLPWTVYPPPGLTSHTEVVDLRPQMNLKVRVTANLDRATGVLGWSLTSIDPDTGLPPVSDLVGFLPANVSPPEGEGSLEFTVAPKAGLLLGTVIHNQASIDFDGAATPTPEWDTTLLDVTPPESQVCGTCSGVQPLGANQDSVSFTVRWQAANGTTDLRDYSVYVSENGGAYHPWRQFTTATADTFAGPGGRTYAFYSLARDVSGNLEPVPGAPDAQTFSRVAVEGPQAWGLSLEGTAPNPVLGPARVWFTLPSRERALLEVMDIAGRRLLRREVGTLGPGRHSVDVSGSVRRPGLYFLRLAQGNQELRGRMVVFQ